MVCIIPGASDGQSASVMAASPEGIIRYWPSVASEGAYVEVSTELDGQECFSLTQFEVILVIISCEVSVHMNQFGFQFHQSSFC